MASERLVKDITVLEDKISRLDTDELEKSGYKEGLRDVRDFLYSFKFGDFRLGGQHLQFDIESQFPIAKTHCTIINQERDSADRVEVLNTSECKRTVKVFPSHWTFG